MVNDDRCIENKFSGIFSLFLVTVEGSNPSGPYLKYFLNPAGQS